MASYLIADSGSTKTDWCLLRKGKKNVYFKTEGINPYLQSREHIQNTLENELPWNKAIYPLDAIYYFGAGASTKEKQAFLANILKQHFSTKKAEVQGDMMAAAKALCGKQKGIVCILGTGSAACYYDGQKIKKQLPSLGYIAGDEGSGNYMGKKILQHYAYDVFDSTLKTCFEKYFGSNISLIINKLYHESFPNRYLATFVQLLKDNRGHYIVENIIEDCLSDFLQYHVLQYPESRKTPVFFSGSIAYEFADTLTLLCKQYELKIGKIEKSPIGNLIKYYKNLIKE